MSVTMPQKCSSCGGASLQRIEGTYAFTKVTRVKSEVVFFPSSGIPVILYVCSQCGAMTPFSAQVMKAI